MAQLRGNRPRRVRIVPACAAASHVQDFLVRAAWRYNCARISSPPIAFKARSFKPDLAQTRSRPEFRPLMLTLPGQPLLDKIAPDRRFGAPPARCAAMPGAACAPRVEAFAGVVVGHGAAGRVGRAQRGRRQFFLRGHAPAEGNLPIEDRETLEQLPYVRENHRHADSSRAAALPGLAPAATPAAGDHARISIKPTISAKTIPHSRADHHARAHGGCIAPDRSYRMTAGELWALNNSATHAVWNALRRTAAQRT